MSNPEKIAEQEKMLEDPCYEPPAEYWLGDPPKAEEQGGAETGSYPVQPNRGIRARRVGGLFFFHIFRLNIKVFYYQIKKRKVMDKFLSSRYFDLDKFQFREVFLEDKPLWETVKNIEYYINSFFAENGVKNLGGRFPRAFMEGEHIYVGENTKIYPGTYVGENVIIGNNCEIRPGAFIRENVILGNECIVGNSCEIKNSILLNHAWTSHFNYVGDSIIGSNANIAASTIFANIRFDFFDEKPSTIGIKHEEDFYDTGLLKFGSILGDNSQTGCKSLINPGTFIGKNCILGGFKNHRGLIAENSKIIDHLKD